MEPPVFSVHSLHALAYCERLFFLEEVEKIRIADERVYAGRRLHLELVDSERPPERLTFESDQLGIRGTVDVLRRRDGELTPYEHKRGRSAGTKSAREAWLSDRIQVGAYSLLVEEAMGEVVTEARVRYHADGVTVRVPVDEGLRREVRGAIERARVVAATVERPPVTRNERLCVRCSLSPVCLPEESRLAVDTEWSPVRLLPAHAAGITLHVTDHGAQVARRSDELVVKRRDGEEAFPVASVSTVVLHGFAQITTQAVRLCVDRGIDVHWTTVTGGHVASLAPSSGTAQRHLRQLRALDEPVLALRLARRLVAAKVENQLRFLLRATRREARTEAMTASLTRIRGAIRESNRAASDDELLGIEGNAAAAYFAALSELLGRGDDVRFYLDGRSRRPPRDRVNALLSFGYALLYRVVVGAILSVGLHPGMGFYHRPRSSAHPLALDVMELFRTPIVDMAFLAALSRKTFDAARDFSVVPGQVMLSDAGRRKAIEVFERRLADTWKHSSVGYSLSYARIVELEVRLLEKEWMEGVGGLFARMRIR